jgi:hypothetical protein
MAVQDSGRDTLFEVLTQQTRAISRIISFVIWCLSMVVFGLLLALSFVVFLSLNPGGMPLFDAPSPIGAQMDAPQQRFAEAQLTGAVNPVVDRGKGGAETTASILAAWSQLVPKSPECTAGDCTPQVSVRVIRPLGAGCVGISVNAEDGSDVVMKSRTNPKPEMLGVDVCESLLELSHPGVILTDGRELSWRGVQTETPNSVVILGDSGCDAAKGQNCGHPGSWPLARISARAAAPDGTPPDLFLHVGDFRYRDKDDWESWRVDVFAPLAPLLAITPLVAVRGNHDNCFLPNKGWGWAYFLATEEPLSSCNPEDPASVTPPYAIDLGKLRLLVVDSSQSRYKCDEWNSGSVGLDSFIASAAMAGSDTTRSVWLLTHYPVFSVIPPASETCTSSGDLAEKSYRERLQPLVLDNPVSTVVSGDLHSFQFTMPATGGRLQVIAGSSGTKLDTAAPVSPPHGYVCQAEGPPVVDARIRRSFGFVQASRNGSNWTFAFRTPTTAIAATDPACTVPDRSLSCVTLGLSEPPECEFTGTASGATVVAP